MISYAQNGEDVILARALADVHSGFYVDVGAASPLEASVTRHFYEAGWSGINIEPVPAYIAELQSARPRDHNVAAAAAEAPGTRVLFVVREEPGLSTLSERQARIHQGDGHQLEELEVEVVTLDDVLGEVDPKEIDFLKIDVEGSERDVLEGINLCAWRPRVIVIEASRPNTGIATHQEWEHLITSHEYDYASTDGLNRYYVRREDEALRDLLQPANCLDDYISYRTQLVEDQIDSLREYVQHLEQELVGKHWYIEQLEERVEALSPAQHSAESEGQVESMTPAIGPVPNDPAPRIAIISTPRTGTTYLRTLLAAAVGAAGVAAKHPADVQWELLPDAVVLQLHWRRSLLFANRLRDEGFEVITLCRHPLDVLLSILRFAQVGSTTEWLGDSEDDDRLLQRAAPTSRGFRQWATTARAQELLGVSSEWWDDPAARVVRYEDLIETPGVILSGLLQTMDREMSQPLSSVLEGSGPERLHELSGGIHVWDPRPGKWREFLPRELSETLRHVFERQFDLFGYDSENAAPPTHELATERWIETGLDVDLDDISNPDTQEVWEKPRLGDNSDSSRRPCPPPYLVERVIGTADRAAFAASGDLQVKILEKVLAKVGVTLPDVEDVLDFGCGPGRVLMSLRDHIPNGKIYGVDIDEEAVAWMNANIVDVDAREIGHYPPTEFDDSSFDLIIALSVFTHFDEDMQDLWLRELARLARRGSPLLLTVHGEFSWTTQFADRVTYAPELREVDARRQKQGFAFWRNGYWSSWLPDYYQTSFHQPEYVRSHWSQFFDVLHIEPGCPELHQDIVVLSTR